MVNHKFENENILQAESNISIIGSENQSISIRCPHCSHIGVFSPIGNGFKYMKPISGNSKARFGGLTVFSRLCPNVDCQGIVFTVSVSDGQTKIIPPEVLDFDGENLPDNLLRTLKEAINCHAAGAYRASAMMVRRLLEEICEESNVSGKDLHTRLQSLKTKIILPDELFEAMSELKALGNDAAHITAKEYLTIGKDEVEDSIELAKEILKARYQLKGLLDRLRSRKGQLAP